MALTVKKCLLIGINYNNTELQLSGCINDTLNLKEFLINNKYFKSDEFIMMNDNLTGDFYPTKENIEKQLISILEFTQINKNKFVELFISYSGHGYYIQDTNKDEKEGKDEVICPVDCMTNGFITDDYLKSIINQFHTKVHVVYLIDACHSATMLDLKYNYLIDAKNSCVIDKLQKATSCNCVMISGCRDDQTSADAYLSDQTTKKYEAQGAMTAGFIANHTDKTNYITLINNMRNWLKTNGFSQIPQLSSGRAISTRGLFLLNQYDD